MSSSSTIVTAGLSWASSRKSRTPRSWWSARKAFDTLVGGPQGDLLVANTGGLQTMTGDTGGDQFIVNHNMNVKITDFKPGTDKIVFDDAGSLNFHDVHIKADHNNTVVEAGGNHIVLLNVNPLQLHASDFIYHG